MGHASITMTMRYAHLSESVGDEMISRLAPARTSPIQGRGGAGTGTPTAHGLTEN
ncbi:hypothetical protein [Plesiocystis pacifica]|uniref:hypothetical protein n=1 Tax=Plesiocystis pacifica TaxID=191768 RepID=UPI001E5E5485|nr:hypothetical protein [Plesiocystis pacifica]